MKIDLAVVGRDPLFGGGGHAQTDAFLTGARALGRDGRFFYDRHPGLRGPVVTWRRVEALRARSAATRVLLPPARSLWVVSTHAADGFPAAASGHPYSCWIGTTVDGEWQGRRAAMRGVRRAAARSSLAVLRQLEQRVLVGARTIYGTSASSCAEIAAAAGRNDVGVLPIPVDTEWFVPASDEAWRATLAAPTLIFVGRADDPRKNIDLLLAVARLLPDVKFMLAGNPPAVAVPPNVRVLGRVADTAAVLRLGTLFVLPSMQEGFGIVAAEALSCGLPVVTTPSGGPEELVRMSDGGQVTDGFEPTELARVIQTLLDRPVDLEQMRGRGRAHVEREHSRAAFQHALATALARADQ